MIPIYAPYKGVLITSARPHGPYGCDGVHRPHAFMTIGDCDLSTNLSAVVLSELNPITHLLYVCCMSTLLAPQADRDNKVLHTRCDRLIVLQTSVQFFVHS